jgi:hypothetical protein
MKTRSRVRQPASAAAADPAAPAAGSLAPGPVARLVPLDPGVYAFSLATDSGWRDAVVGLALPAVEVCAPPDCNDAIAITDMFGGAGSWLGGRRRMLFVEAPAAGAAALVTAYPARDPDAAPLAVEIRRVADSAAWESAAPAPPLPPVMTLLLADRPTLLPGQLVSLHIIAHIRGRGDVRFIDVAWAGRLGTGHWLEAFTLTSRNPVVAAAIEYKGLSTGGSESPWLPCGAMCGTRGRASPLVGFAIRQKAGAGGARFDCDYSGYFQSGETAGPARNGAPCRSPHDHDPLEGMQVRITPRAAG